jgi:urease accessory protein
VTIDVEPTAPGGPRLQPAHFEAGHVPVEVRRYGTSAHTLPIGSPGKVGILELGFERRAASGRTELVQHYQKSPLQIMRPLYYDTARPGMPYVYVMTTGGGILHNDRQRTDLAFGADTEAHVTTQAHTKVYRMESGYATSLVNLSVGAGAYVEYLPDPLIPYVDARFYQRVRATMGEGSTLVAGDTLYAGRLSRGERYAYAAIATDFEVVAAAAPGEVERPIAFDRLRLVPGAGELGGVAVTAGRDVVSTLYVVTRRAQPAAIVDALTGAARSALDANPDESAVFGASVLPGDAGAWLRYLGDDTVASSAVASAAAAAVHELLLGTPAPAIRK